MSIHVSWSSIELLHNVLITLTHLDNLKQRSFKPVSYKAKVKLHGKNTAVQVNEDGLVAQSRTEILSDRSDLNGFQKWMTANESYFKSLPVGVIVFGEWAGPGVEKGMAVSQLPNKIFAVFALQNGRGETAEVIYDPQEIARILAPALGCPGLHILPWEDTGEITIPYGDKPAMEALVPRLNQLVDQVEKEDPWIKRTFGISGLGEGLVFYPVPGSEPNHPEALALVMFKAKGEKHRTAGTKTAVQVDPVIVKSTAEFVELMVTQARLEQAVSQVCEGNFDIKNMSKFLSWLVSDVQKESSAELNAAGLEWKHVAGAVQTKAREWFKERCNLSAKC